MIIPQPELDGILLVDKPTDHTSHDVIARLRGILKMKRIGHAGTLDPMATGLLVVLLGKSTKLSQYLMGTDKEYEGEIELGKVTNTQDAEGEVLSEVEVPMFSEEEIRAGLKNFLGDQYQTPPMFSAIKIKGKPLYKSARAGEEVEREQRFIRVMKFDLLKWERPVLGFRTLVSKGTYVRTLANDLGEKLGCGGHLKSLRRTASGVLRVEEALTLEQIQGMTRTELSARLVPMHKAVPVALGEVKGGVAGA